MKNDCTQETLHLSKLLIPVVWNLLQRPPESSVEPAHGTVSLEHNYIYLLFADIHDSEVDESIVTGY